MEYKQFLEEFNNSSADQKEFFIIYLFYSLERENKLESIFKERKNDFVFILEKFKEADKNSIEYLLENLKRNIDHRLEFLNKN